jgi:hypothetical protein
VPYGYDRNPEEHTRLIVDDYAAGVVKRIFTIRATGMGYAAIAGVLNRENILPPRLYYYNRHGLEVKPNTNCTTIWRDITIREMLKNELYLGHTVAFKNKVRSYRDSKSVKRDPSEWIRTENTHTPIIDTALWDKVQKINAKAKSRADNNREHQTSLFSKLLVCPDCNVNMAYHMSIKHYPRGTFRYGGYYCRTHSSSGRTICSWHRISEANLIKLVISHIKENAGQIALNEDGILKTLQNRLLGKHRVSKSDISKELEQRLHALETQLEQLYEDKVCGDISAEAFTSAANKAETLRSEITDRLSTLKQGAEHAETKLNDINRWIGLIKEKSTLKEVDRDLLESLIEKIEIGEKRVVDGVKVQDVRIYYKYVGLC